MHADPPAPGWSVVDGRWTRSWRFPDYAQALSFVNRISEIAESAHHHPDVAFGWGYVRLSLWTHDVGAITELDHRLATAINALDAPG